LLGKRQHFTFCVDCRVKRLTEQVVAGLCPDGPIAADKG
jgi:hypothetical protein